eukprot:NODE_208_length_14728_cov_0.400164.p7 type:complete len:264 gc:universal NODE_208_length_14728_cov_0.400164:13539-12748(-)
MSAHLQRLFKDMPSGLKKVTFEQMFFENSKLSKYVQDYIKENKSKIVLKRPKANMVEFGIMTNDAVSTYDHTVQTEVNVKDQYVQQELFRKDQILQAETDTKDQYMQTDELVAQKRQSVTSADRELQDTAASPSINTKKLVENEIMERKLNLEKTTDREVKPATSRKTRTTAAKPKVKAASKTTVKPTAKANRKRAAKKTIVREPSSDFIPETPQKRESLLSVDIPTNFKKRKIDVDSDTKKATNATFSKRGAPADKLKKLLK